MEGECPKGDGDDHHSETVRLHQRVIERDVHDDRCEEHERERHKAVRQKQHAGRELQGKHGNQEAGINQRSHELPREALGPRYFDEGEESIQPEDGERESEQAAGDERYLFHEITFRWVS